MEGSSILRAVIFVLEKMSQHGVAVIVTLVLLMGRVCKKVSIHYIRFSAIRICRLLFIFLIYVMYKFYICFLEDYKKVQKTSCTSANKFLTPSFDTLKQAKLECAADKTCGLVLDGSCENRRFQLCKSFNVKNQTYDRDCVHKKEESHGIYY